MDAICTSSPCSFFTTCWADRTFVLLIASQSASGDNSSLHLTTHLDLFMTNVKLMTPLTFSSSSSHSFLVTCQMQSAGNFVYDLHIWIFCEAEIFLQLYVDFRCWILLTWFARPLIWRTITLALLFKLPRKKACVVPLEKVEVNVNKLSKIIIVMIIITIIIIIIIVIIIIIIMIIIIINDIYNNNDNTIQWHLGEWASIHSNNVYLYRDEIIWCMLTAVLKSSNRKNISFTHLVLWLGAVGTWAWIFL